MGVLLLAAFQLPFVLVNAIPGMVAGLLTPLYSLALAYFYEDTRLRVAERQREDEVAAEGVAAPPRGRGRSKHSR